MIVGTAGHIDHGKTSLLRALTGIEGDRRPAERQRGITIDLGYLYADLGDGSPTGFIDVPGHERFVHNMLAGASGIDCVLLVVAADDGLMPQTREHLAIVELLGIRRALVALTKIDRVEPQRVQQVRTQVEHLLASGPLARSPIFPLSSSTGEGVEALREALGGLAGEVRERSREDTSAWRWTGPSASPAAASWSPVRPSPDRSRWATNCSSATPDGRCGCAACTRRTGPRNRPGPASAWP